MGDYLNYFQEKEKEVGDYLNYFQEKEKEVGDYLCGENSFMTSCLLRRI